MDMISHDTDRGMVVCMNGFYAIAVYIHTCT